MPIYTTMSSEGGKKMADVSSVVISDSQTGMHISNSKLSQRVNRKHVIVAVTSVILVASVLASILVGMQLFTEAHTQLIKDSMRLNSNTIQETILDPGRNIIQYHVTNPEVDAMIVEDFNKNIGTLKVTEDSTSSCYLSPLEGTSSFDRKNIKKAISFEPITVNATHSLTQTVVFRPSRNPIPDPSFLSSTARNMCKGAPIFWVVPAFESSVKETSAKFRTRRACHTECGYQCHGGRCGWFCNLVCRW